MSSSSQTDPFPRLASVTEALSGHVTRSGRGLGQAKELGNKPKVCLQCNPRSILRCPLLQSPPPDHAGLSFNRRHVIVVNAFLAE